jgi:sortase A
MGATLTPQMDRAEAQPTLDHNLKVFRFAGWAIVGLGVLVLGFIFHQMVLTTWLANANQVQLTETAEQRFATVEVTEVPYHPLPATESPNPTGSVLPQLEDPTPREASLLVESAPATSEPFAIIRAPSLARLGAGWTVVEGVGAAELKTGAGHMPDTPLPGMPGNAVISGHRTTYGAPFNELDKLAPGDVIEVETAVGTHTYVVRGSLVVSPFDVWVTDPREGAWLTLTTCNPEFSARERLVVFAELQGGPNWEAIYG